MDTMKELETVQQRIEELNPLLLDLENQIAASTDQKERAEFESQRSDMATEYNQMQAKEQELLAESQTLERYTSMFQTFVDSLEQPVGCAANTDQQTDDRYRAAGGALQVAGRFT